jgi:hypothetical protein
MRTTFEIQNEIDDTQRQLNAICHHNCRHEKKILTDTSALVKKINRLKIKLNQCIQSQHKGV